MASTETDPSLIATCHCGRVKIEIPSKPAKLNECQCSVCYKYGVLWAYYTRGDVKITAEGTSMDKYIRTDEDADGNTSFNRCGHCGCMTHWTGEGEYAGLEHRMGVNCRMLPMSAIEGVESKVSPGPRKG